MALRTPIIAKHDQQLHERKAPGSLSPVYARLHESSFLSSTNLSHGDSDFLPFNVVSVSVLQGWPTWKRWR